MRGGMGRAGAGRARRALPALALVLPVPLAGPADAAAVSAVATDASRIVVRFDAPVTEAVATLLQEPRRIALDVGSVARTFQGAAGGSITSVRRAGGGKRLLLNFARPMIVTDGDFDASGRELTLKLKLVDARRYAAASLAGPTTFLPFKLSFDRRPRYKVTRPVPAPAKAGPLPRVRGDETRPLVVIDAGHGGVDPGAINPVSRLREKDVTLKIARAIRDELLRSGRVRVALTRDGDKFLVLRERYRIARRLRASLFISVHCDSVGNEQATGASAYTLSEVASDKEAARLAARENKADVIAGVNLGDAGSDVSSILIDLTQRETMNSSSNFARLLGREAKPLIQTKAKFHRMASLMVLKAPDMPSILFETGYISNPQDAAFLDSADGRERIAEAVRRAVEIHFARRMAGS